MPNPPSTHHQPHTPTIVIVAGAHPLAEEHDRPTAYGLAARIQAWLQTHALAARVLVLSDVWYLNDLSLREHPTISIGNPSVNALSAYLADKLPSVYVVDDALIVQIDTGAGEAVGSDAMACCWGVDHAQTKTATDVFCDRYLSDFFSGALGLVSPLGKVG